MQVPLQLSISNPLLAKATISDGIPSEPTTLITIPPLNAQINFTMAPNFGPTEIKTKAQAQDQISIPNHFNWIDNLASLSKPFNQGNCGCCWAVAVASVISDIFQISGILSFNPQISASYLISCADQNNQCGGGNSYLALEWISNHGVSTSKSSNYEWCSKQEQCTSFNAKTSVTPVQSLNSLVPSCKNISPDLLFFVKDVHTTLLTEEMCKDKTLYDSFSLLVKKHILQVGPVVAGYQVMNTLLKGNFFSELNPDGIYLENVDYKTQTLIEPVFKGSHAVSIIGWGTGKVSGKLLPRMDPQKMYEIPYWIVRNSWGDQWGEKGIYKHARYPFNLTSQFDVLVTVNSTPTSGIIFCTPETFYPYVKENYIMPTPTWKPPHCSESENVNLHYFFIGIACLVTILFCLGFLIYTANKEPKKVKEVNNNDFQN